MASYRDSRVTRGDRERDQDRYNEREHRRERDGRDPARDRRDYPETPRGGAQLNEFFVDGEGIHREVMQRELCKYLGPDALSRPGTYNGAKGYIVRANMIEDLKKLSREYEREKREMSSRGYQGSLLRASPTAAPPNHSSDMSYMDSRTRERHDAVEPYDQATRFMYQDPYHPDQYRERLPEGRLPPGYPSAGGAYQTGSNYSSQNPSYPSGTGYPPSAAYPPGTSYPQGTTYPLVTAPYPSTSGYVTSGFPSTAGIPGARNEPNYIYTEQSGDFSNPGYPYPQPGSYSTNTQGREPRAAANFPYVTSPQDSSIRGIVDDRDYAMYNQQMMSGQPGRTGHPAPSRSTPTGYDASLQPQPRDPFGSRSEPSRDDRRRR
ncbi:MAG: hypothetical protein Q9214_002004 [Letrouitia sp. 1 TL-2023]